MKEQLIKYAEMAMSLLIEYGLKVISALIVLIIGLWVIKMINKAIARMMDKRKFDPSLQPFLKSLLATLLKVLLAITVMSMVGIEMTSFIAILGAAGLAIGLALSGTLQNFAGGVMILILRPYKVEDFIEAQGFTGTVKEIQIFHTILNTADNKMVIIPNGPISTGAVINYSGEDIRRVDWVFGIAYGDDLEKAKSLIIDVLTSEELILSEPQPPFARLGEMGDSSINIKVRAWSKTSEYWNVFFNVNENVYKTFNDNGINIPFPQMDVHLKKDI